MSDYQDAEEFYLSWKGEISGPLGIEEIRRSLKAGKINSLYKVQVGGDWVLLRDFLAKQSKAEKASKIEEERLATAERLEMQTAQFNHPLAAVPVPEDDTHASQAAPQEVFHSGPEVSHVGAPYEAPAQKVPVGLAVSAFVLSIFFFVPMLNGLTWLLTLIFGHLALSGASMRPKGKAATLAWVGLWITYVQMGFLAIGMIWGVWVEYSDLKELYLLFHIQMLGCSISAFIGAAVLMLAVKSATQHLISFASCYVGALLPSAVSVLSIFLLQFNTTYIGYSWQKQLLLLLLVYVLLFLGQIFFWAKFIHISNNQELGYAGAARVSLFYTLVLFIVGFGYGFLIGLLSL